MSSTKRRADETFSVSDNCVEGLAHIFPTAAEEQIRDALALTSNDFDRACDFLACKYFLTTPARARIDERLPQSKGFNAPPHPLKSAGLSGLSFSSPQATSGRMSMSRVTHPPTSAGGAITLGATHPQSFASGPHTFGSNQRFPIQSPSLLFGQMTPGRQQFTWTPQTKRLGTDQTAPVSQQNSSAMFQGVINGPVSNLSAFDYASAQKNRKLINVKGLPAKIAKARRMYILARVVGQPTVQIYMPREDGRVRRDWCHVAATSKNSRPAAMDALKAFKFEGSVAGLTVEGVSPDNELYQNMDYRKSGTYTLVSNDDTDELYDSEAPMTAEVTKEEGSD
ncbi:hypothetical protein GGR57DRAFT_505826 [Xylariaceae sp. FL1272]|nr:hypothetical protein GGR57DRAFT_505826 [Xylariaceae sp. FL1272]